MHVLNLSRLVSAALIGISMVAMVDASTSKAPTKYAIFSPSSSLLPLQTSQGVNGSNMNVKRADSDLIIGLNEGVPWGAAGRQDTAYNGFYMVDSTGIVTDTFAVTSDKTANYYDELNTYIKIKSLPTDTPYSVFEEGYMGNNPGIIPYSGVDVFVTDNKLWFRNKWQGSSSVTHELKTLNASNQWVSFPVSELSGNNNWVPLKIQYHYNGPTNLMYYNLTINNHVLQQDSANMSIYPWQNGWRWSLNDLHVTIFPHYTLSTQGRVIGSLLPLDTGMNGNGTQTTLKGAVEVGDILFCTADDAFNIASVDSAFFPKYSAFDSPGDSIITTVPHIAQILYCPPGNSSSAATASTVSINNSTQISSQTSMNNSFYVGADIQPDLWDGFFGLSLKAGFNINTQSSQANTYDYSRSVSNGISTGTAGGDLVVSDNVTIKSLLIHRRREPYIFDDSANTDPKKMSLQLISLPTTATPLVVYPCKTFINDFKSDTCTMKNFWALYAKDSTGKVRSNYRFKSGTSDNFVLNGGPQTSSTDIVTEKSSSATQSYSFSIGPFISAEFTAGGVSIGDDWSLDLQTSNESSSINDTTFSYSAQYGDSWGWDKNCQRLWEIWAN